MEVFNNKNIRPTVWIALRRLDLNDNRIIALREVHIPTGAQVTSIKQILAHSFRLDTSQTILKIRNNRGCLIPINSAMPPNCKQICLDSHSDGTHSLQSIHWCASNVMLHFYKSYLMMKRTHPNPGWPEDMPYVLEVAKNYQHVNPRPRRIPMIVINKTLKSRLQSIVKRIERLDELLPQIKLKQHERLTKNVARSFLSIRGFSYVTDEACFLLLGLGREHLAGHTQKIHISDIELLNQKLVFLHKRMQMAESYSWEGMLRRAPLW